MIEWDCNSFIIRYLRYLWPSYTLRNILNLMHYSGHWWRSEERAVSQCWKAVLSLLPWRFFMKFCELSCLLGGRSVCLVLLKTFEPQNCDSDWPAVWPVAAAPSPSQSWKPARSVSQCLTCREAGLSSLALSLFCLHCYHSDLLSQHG